MDKWSRNKATETCGGLGMAKYVDSNEARRLNRLKSVRSSIGSNMGHSGWQKQQIEKRRKEQLRQRRKGARKKPLGDGIRVDTKISKSDAISKCGLKLKVHDEDDNKTKGMNDKALAELQKEASQKATSVLRSNRRRCGPIKQNISEDPAATRRNPIRQRPKQGSQKGGPNPRFRGDDGKENSDNSTNREPPIDEGVKRAAAAPKRVPAPANKYFMDIDSLRREHADAIRMLEELDEREGNERRSLDSADECESADFPRRRDSGGGRRDGAGGPGRSPAHRANNTLDDEFVRDCSSKSSTVFGDERMDGDALGREESHALTESFLNMQHLSISLGDEFENARGDYMEDGDGRGIVAPLAPLKNRSFAFDDGRCDDLSAVASLTPRDDCFEDGDNEGGVAKNRSFTLSCASVEDSDFFGDAESDTCSSGDEDGYSSGTF